MERRLTERPIALEMVLGPAWGEIEFIYLCQRACSQRWHAKIPAYHTSRPVGHVHMSQYDHGRVMSYHGYIFVPKICVKQTCFYLHCLLIHLWPL